MSSRSALSVRGRIGQDTWIDIPMPIRPGQIVMKTRKHLFVRTHHKTPDAEGRMSPATAVVLKKDIPKPDPKSNVVPVAVVPRDRLPELPIVGEILEGGKVEWREVQ